MFRIHHINLALVAGSLAILAYAAAPSPAGSYVSTYPAAPVASEAVSTSSAAPSPPNVLEYFYFSPAQPAKPASAGWVSGGQYSLPPGAEAVTIEASAFGSITAGPGGAQYQTFVVRLTIANSGTESLMMAPSSMRFMDESGHLVTGATAYSGTVRVSTDTVGPGGRDELQLEFGLPPVLALNGLGPVDVDVPYAYGDTSYLTELRFVPAPPPPCRRTPRQTCTTITTITTSTPIPSTPIRTTRTIRPGGGAAGPGGGLAEPTCSSSCTEITSSTKTSSTDITNSANTKTTSSGSTEIASSRGMPTAGPPRSACPTATARGS